MLFLALDTCCPIFSPIYNSYFSGNPMVTYKDQDYNRTTLQINRNSEDDTNLAPVSSTEFIPKDDDDKDTSIPSLKTMYNSID
jgi:hypothetical protein